MIVAVHAAPGGAKGFLLRYLQAYLRLERPDLAGRWHVGLLDDSQAIVQQFGSDPARWGLLTQLHFLEKHHEAAAAAAPVAITEGSLASHAVHAAEAEAGMHPVERAVLAAWQAVPAPAPADALVCLQAPPMEHLHRIMNQNRREQAHISLQLLTRLHAGCAAAGAAAAAAGTPVLNLPVAQFCEDNEPSMAAIVSQLVAFVESCCL